MAVSYTHLKLPAADYKMAVHLESGRGVYTFCMCPGGRVVASASEDGGVVTNGIDVYKRQVKGDTRLNNAKMAEIAERKSM